MNRFYNYEEYKHYKNIMYILETSNNPKEDFDIYIRENNINEGVLGAIANGVKNVVGGTYDYIFGDMLDLPHIGLRNGLKNVGNAVKNVVIGVKNNIKNTSNSNMVDNDNIAKKGYSGYNPDIDNSQEFEIYIEAKKMKELLKIDTVKRDQWRMYNGNDITMDRQFNKERIFKMFSDNKLFDIKELKSFDNIEIKNYLDEYKISIKNLLNINFEIIIYVKNIKPSFKQDFLNNLSSFIDLIENSNEMNSKYLIDLKKYLLVTKKIVLMTMLNYISEYNNKYNKNR